MRWKVHGRRTMYESDWVNVYLDDVELADGKRVDHHVVTMPKSSQTAIVLSRDGDSVLLIWRHRFITDKWGWEVPAGWVESGESSVDSIRREILEETGYEVGQLTPLIEYDAIPGISSMHFTCWVAREVEQIGAPKSDEGTTPQWHSLAAIPELLAEGSVSDGPSITALATFLSLQSAGLEPE